MVQLSIIKQTLGKPNPSASLFKLSNTSRAECRNGSQHRHTIPWIQHQQHQDALEQAATTLCGEMANSRRTDSNGHATLLLLQRFVVEFILLQS